MGFNQGCSRTFAPIRNSLLVFVCLFLCAAPNSTHAEVTLDGSLGPSGPVGSGTLPDGTFTDYLITHDLGRQVNSNLFHSFGKFSIETGKSGTFTGPGTIENIIGRVTGGELSNIDGLLRSTIDGANLFLLNPAGVLFGPNASLDLNGSFHVSTGDYLPLADGGIFYANPAQNSVLTVAPPSAFGFLNDNPAGISIQGSVLEVPDGETLSFVGGDIEIVGGTISAPGGRVNLASVASAGEVIPNMPDQAPDLKVDAFERLGDIDISQDGRLQVSGSTAGNIFIRGGNLTLDSSIIFSAAFGSSDAGDIDIRLAEDLSLSNRGGPRRGTTIDSSSYSNGAGGDILLEVRRLTISDGSQITSHAQDNCTSRGGNITINAAESVSISGVGANGMQSYVSTSTFGNGDGGTIYISTPTLNIDDHAGIFAVAYMGFDWMGNVVGGGRGGDIFLDVGSLTITNAGIGSQAGALTTGHAGNITITATEAVSMSGSSAIRSGSHGDGDGGTISISTPVLTMDCSGIVAEAGIYSSGDAGDVLLEVGSLALTSGAQIQTSTEGVGQGGDITITATDSVSILGCNIEGYQSALISSTWGGGKGGTISISAPSLTIDEGGLAAQSAADADAGNILVNVGILRLTNGARIMTSTFDSGAGGNIDLQAKRIELNDGAFISAESFGTGNAGNITIDASDVLSLKESSVTTEAAQADGGNIKVNVQHMVHLKDSEITASVGGGPETVGGNIDIDPEYVILDGSKIIANAFEGKGGNIKIVAGCFLADPESVVDASSALGIDGQVDIQAPVTEISGTFTPLREDYLSAIELLREQCMARVQGGKYSSFVVGGRDGLPLEPGGLLPSPIP